jgi:hypothetical protein
MNRCFLAGFALVCVLDTTETAVVAANGAEFM